MATLKNRKKSKKNQIILILACLTLHFSFAARSQYDPCEGGICRVHFDKGRCDLKKESLPILDEGLRLIREEPHAQAKIFIVGHTDNVESPGQALQLSLCRAKSVERYLEKKGIPASRLEAKNEGDAKPLVSNEIEPGRQQNRRVDLILPK